MQGRASLDRFASGLAGIDHARSSPNHGERVGGPAWPDCIVLHYTGMKDGPSAVDWLCNSSSGVSCHYVVTEPGTILQLVDEERRAWHAGQSSWAGVADLNSASIGIEIVNGGHDYGLPPFPEPQIDAVIALCRDIAQRHEIRPERILAHSDIAPARKRDPGEGFPWHRLAAADIGHWLIASEAAVGETLGPDMQGDDVVAFQAGLAAYGYGVGVTGVYDAETATVCRAFQRHFRQGCVDGIADPATRATLSELLDRLPPHSPDGHAVG